MTNNWNPYRWEEKIRVTNLYVPPIRATNQSRSHEQSERLSQARSEIPSQEGEETEDEQQETDQQGAGKLYIETEGFDMTRWPHKEYDMIFGDVNAHSPLWDWIV